MYYLRKEGECKYWTKLYTSSEFNAYLKGLYKGAIENYKRCELILDDVIENNLYFTIRFVQGEIK